MKTEYFDQKNIIYVSLALSMSLSTACIMHFYCFVSSYIENHLHKLLSTVCLEKKLLSAVCLQKN